MKPRALLLIQALILTTMSYASAAPADAPKLQLHGHYKELSPGTYLVVLSPPAKLVASITLLQSRLGIRSAAITGVGVVRNTTLGFYKFNADGTPGGGAHTDDVVAAPREISALTCNLTTEYVEDGKSTPAPPHCHISLAGVPEPASPTGAGWTVVGGHLTEAEVAVTAELIVTTYPGFVKKVPGGVYGGKVIDIGPAEGGTAF